MQIQTKLILGVLKIMKEEKKNVVYLLYYSIIEAILLLSIPLASSFVINSILAHASISIIVLGSIVITIFILTTLLQVVKQYIVEKFEQKIFLSTGIKIARMALFVRESSVDAKNLIDKYMNYFFDIGSIQKIFPILLLDGTGLFVKVVASLLLLLAFDFSLFILGVFFFIIFVVLIIFFGTNGIKYALERSDAKHCAIHYLHTIPQMRDNEKEILKGFDSELKNYVRARDKMFRIILRQLSLTYFMEGLIFSSFLIVGGNLVIHGYIPLGEFVAAEIIVVSITSALKSFMKQIDYIYDMAEGMYKVEKLSLSLEEHTL